MNPEEAKFNLNKPITWFKRGYIRHYLEGSSELRKSVVDINWKGLNEAAKTSKKIPLKDFISILNFKRAYNGIKEHPEGIICLLYTSPSPRDRQKSRMPSSA